MSNTGTRFNWPDFIKRVAVIAIPVALQNLLTTTGSMVDAMMISRIGPGELGAVGLCAQFSSLMFSCYWGFVGGGMLFISQFFGSKDEENLNRAYGLTLTCMMSVALVFAVLAVRFPDLIMNLYTDKQALHEIGVSYLRIVGLSYPLMVLSMAMAVMLRCTEMVRIPLYGSVAAVVTNIFLNWVLIFGKLGFKPMGVKGAAIATLSAQLVSITVIIIFALIKKHPFLFAVQRHFRWEKGFSGEFFRKCSPIIANEVLIGVGNMVINVVLGRQSEDAIAAISVFRTIEGLVIGFFAGFSNASSILVGKEVGAGCIDVAYNRAWRLVYMCQAVIGAVMLTVVALHTPILTLMGMDGERFKIAFGLICIFMVAAVIRMGNWTQNDTFRAAGDATYGTVLEIVFMWVVLIPTVWVTGMVLKLPVFVVFTCCYIDEPIRYVLMQIHLFSGKWIRPVTPEGRAALEKWKTERQRQ